MKDQSSLDRKVEELIKDRGFSKRTAAAVVARAESIDSGLEPVANRARTWLAVAAAGLLAVSVFFWSQRSPEPHRYAGLTEASASVLASPEQTDQVWEDTDTVIYGALSAR
ncbi:MAG: hypothetical protein JNM27_18845 [Leptospirales bacterium]|nr:hypothetical protein [Leptospirales bacterium]